MWSVRSWRKRTRLPLQDGARVRQVFAARLDELRLLEQSLSEPVAQLAGRAAPSGHHNDVLALPKLTRQRDRQHLRFVIRQPCLVCGAHHRPGNEVDWWSRLGIEPLQATRTLSMVIHPSGVA
jgi:hypothetical protein